MIDLTARGPSLVVVVGAGGVGKTTFAAALGLRSAAAGGDTLVMTFDPSLRLKDALGVGDAARDAEVAVAAAGTPSGGLVAQPARRARAPSTASSSATRRTRRARDRILAQPFLRQPRRQPGRRSSSTWRSSGCSRWPRAGRYERVILDTPPTRQALDFLEAPQRIVGFLDSGALRVALQALVRRGGPLARRPSRRGSLGRERRGASSTKWSGSTCCATWRSSSGLRAAVRRLPRAGARGAVAAARRRDTLFVLVSRPRRGAGPRHAVLRSPPR